MNSFPPHNLISLNNVFWIELWSVCIIYCVSVVYVFQHIFSQLFASLLLCIVVYNLYSYIVAGTFEMGKRSCLCAKGFFISSCRHTYSDYTLYVLFFCLLCLNRMCK